jgi:hypothetical protein
MWWRSAKARTAASAMAKQERRKGAAAPPDPITAPPAAHPAAMPDTSAAVTQVKVSVSLPGLAVRPTSAYWQENTGAIINPASRLHTIPAGIDRATISGAVKAIRSARSTR